MGAVTKAMDRQPGRNANAALTPFFMSEIAQNLIYIVENSHLCGTSSEVATASQSIGEAIQNGFLHFEKRI